MLKYLACHCILTSLFVIRDKGHNMQLLLGKNVFEVRVYQTKINHFELCHVNNNHSCDICLCTDKSFPEQQPYQSNASSSLC